MYKGTPVRGRNKIVSGLSEDTKIFASKTTYYG